MTLTAPAPVAVCRPRTVRQTGRLIVVVCGLVATLGLAQSTPSPTTAPATRPAPSALTRWDGSPLPRNWNSRLLRMRDIAGLAFDPMTDNRNVQPPEDDEWQQIIQFAQENFPNRWSRFQEAQKDRPDSEVVQRLKNRIVARYRLLKKLESDMPDVYASAVNQAKLEDDAWGAAVAFRRNRKDPKLHAAMREKVAALVKDVLNERQKRIDALMQQIKGQQDDLDRDKQDTDTLIETQMNVLTGDNPGMRGRGFGPG